MRVTVSGIDGIIAQLDRYKQSLEEKNRKFLERLAEIGIETATLKFGQAQYDGFNDVAVSPDPEWVSDNKLVISAQGNAVTFIEFGTGVHYVDYPADATEAAKKFKRGTYGQGKGANPNGWAYYGEMGRNPTPPARIVRETDDGRTVVKTRGNPPARAMYDAAKEMRRRIKEIAREVYGT